VAARVNNLHTGVAKAPLCNDDRKLQMARQMYENKKLPVRDICKALGIPRSTFYKYMKNHVGK
jgi:transcriptional regulator of acetoin/glycerol metabolism